ncbi:MAG: hypothetical protein HY255_07275 [Betaproteobacteria bacterium]|nr:hypothetical protein [Betaproteobacteria bacterium]
MKKCFSKVCFPAVALTLGLAFGSPSARAATFTVNVVAGPAFSPKVLTVNVGDTVTWSGLGGFHTATGTNAEVLCGNAFPSTCTVTFNTPGTFGYRCNVHFQLFGMVGQVIVRSVTVPPTVSISSPTNGATFPAPASFKVNANASVTGGTVTNVEFFRDLVSLGSDTTSPFSVDVAGLADGNYSLTARATANGLMATSAPVNIRVVMPVELRLVSVNYSPLNIFSFDLTTTPGLTYVVESTANLSAPKWTGQETNVATGPLLHFSRFLSPGPLAPPVEGYYRAFIQP